MAKYFFENQQSDSIIIGHGQVIGNVDDMPLRKGTAQVLVGGYVVWWLLNRWISNTLFKVKRLFPQISLVSFCPAYPEEVTYIKVRWNVSITSTDTEKDTISTPIFVETYYRLKRHVITID